MTLYELTNECQDLMDKMDDPSVDKEALKEAIDLTKENLRNKIEGYIKVYMNNQAKIESVHNEIDRLKQRENMLKDRTDVLADSILTVMQLCGLTKIETDLFTAKIKTGNGKVVVTDEDLLDSKFFNVKPSKPTLDRTALRKAILAGEDIEGASIEKEVSLDVA